MGFRAAAPVARGTALALGLASLAGACGTPWGGAVEPLSVGDAAPAPWVAEAGEGGGLLVVWALRSADVATCATAAQAMRHVQRALPDLAPECRPSTTHSVGRAASDTAVAP